MLETRAALVSAQTDSSSKPLLSWWRELLLLLVCITTLWLQLFAPHYIGLADNGDFAKITGRLSLRPLDPDYKFDYFNPNYIRATRYHWKSPVQSSELWPAKLAFYLSRNKKEGDPFNIRWLGAVHSVAFLVTFCVLLVAMRPLAGWKRILLGAGTIWIFTDVSYVSYFNSFYSDTAALLGLLGATALAVLIILRGWSMPRALAFCLLAILLIGSKSQHALWGFLPAAFVAAVSFREERLAAKLVGAGLTAILVASAVVVIGMMPPHYRDEALFNLIFLKVARDVPSPVRELEAVGLSRGDLPYVGLWAFLPESPTHDPKWFEGFSRRTSYATMARYYLRRPSRVLNLLDSDLKNWAPQIRSNNFANLQRKDATKSIELARRFDSWSNLRSVLLFRWPYHLLAWYAVVVAGVVLILWARPGPAAVQMAWVTLGLVSAAMAEFGVSSLADACETYRHLFLFHALTDLTVCMAVAAVVTGTLRTSLSGRAGSKPALETEARATAVAYF